MEKQILAPLTRKQQRALEEGITLMGPYDNIDHPRRCACDDCKRMRADWKKACGHG